MTRSEALLSLVTQEISRARAEIDKPIPDRTLSMMIVVKFAPGQCEPRSVIVSRQEEEDLRGRA